LLCRISSRARSALAGMGVVAVVVAVVLDDALVALIVSAGGSYASTHGQFLLLCICVGHVAPHPTHAAHPRARSLSIQHGPCMIQYGAGIKFPPQHLYIICVDGQR